MSGQLTPAEVAAIRSKYSPYFLGSETAGAVAKLLAHVDYLTGVDDRLSEELYADDGWIARAVDAEAELNRLSRDLAEAQAATELAMRSLTSALTDMHRLSGLPEEQDDYDLIWETLDGKNRAADEAQAAVARVEAVPHEDWCCAKGCACPDRRHAGTEADCTCFVAYIRAALRPIPKEEQR